MKVACCVIAKQENRYIREFVEYYKRIGFDKIYLCDNNDVEGERFDQVLEPHLKDGFVKILDCRGKKKWQLSAFNEVYEKFGRLYDWMAFFDVDEFLTFSGEIKTVGDFLRLRRFEGCDAVTVNWMCYGDNDKLLYEDKPVIERFPEPLPLDLMGMVDVPHNSYVKSILRTGRPFHFENPHCPSAPEASGLKIVTASGIDHPLEESFEKPDYSTAYLRHYTTKTIDEFLYTMTRGSAISGGGGNSFLADALETKFFLVNRKTRSKLELVRERMPDRGNGGNLVLLRWLLQMKSKKLLSLRILRHKLKVMLFYT